MLGRSHGSWSREQSSDPFLAQVPNRCRRPVAEGALRRQPRSNPCSRHCGRFSPCPREDSANPAGSCSLPRGALASSGLQDRDQDAPPVPIASSFFPEGTAGCSKFALPGEPPRAGPRRGAAGAGREGRGSRVGGGGQEGEEQERAASALPFSLQLCHTQTALRVLGLWRESRASERASGRAAAGGPHR